MQLSLIHIFTNSGTAAAGTLAAALDEVKTKGGSIYLLKNAALDSSYWISGDVSIQSAGVSADTPVISATVPVGGKCFTVYHPASLVLSDINLVIQKAEGATGTYGIDVYLSLIHIFQRVALVTSRAFFAVQKWLYPTAHICPGF